MTPTLLLACGDGKARVVNRWRDWWDQAVRDLRHARNAAEDADHEWACFAAQQAAEKALKALALSVGGEPWGHLTFALAQSLPPEIGVPAEALDAARRLDKHYIPARYPNGFAAGHPGELYTRGEADAAIHDAETILDFCRDHLPG
jgi:HEPN domain-containing protein